MKERERERERERETFDPSYLEEVIHQIVSLYAPLSLLEVISLQTFAIFMCLL